MIKNKWTSVKIGCIASFVFFVLIFVIAIFDDSKTTNTDNIPTRSASLTLSIGEEGILNNNNDSNDCEGKVLMSITEDDFNAVTKSSVANDKEGIVELMLQGRVFLVSNCTKIRKIDSAGLLGSISKIRIIETQDHGLPSTGWVAYEFARKKP
ncbi:hypothetical protein KAS41_00745 [Candidatus Parcubacteria bacterium]|nr:hypothetical protein [Candidatus Parcubacteria bacterium]